MRTCAQILTTKNYARDVTAVDARWLPELAPAFFAMKAGASSQHGEIG